MSQISGVFVVFFCKIVDKLCEILLWSDVIENECVSVLYYNDMDPMMELSVGALSFIFQYCALFTLYLNPST